MAGLFGDYHVTPTASALREARKLLPALRDYYELRSHAIKLAYWPGGRNQSGQVCDLDWDTITGMKDPKGCELRIDDVIGGHNNLRVIFFVPEPAVPSPGEALPRLWVIRVMQKKVQQFSSNDLTIFAARVQIVCKRYRP